MPHRPHPIATRCFRYSNYYCNVFQATIWSKWPESTYIEDFGCDSGEVTYKNGKSLTLHQICQWIDKYIKQMTIFMQSQKP